MFRKPSDQNLKTIPYGLKDLLNYAILFYEYAYETNLTLQMSGIFNNIDMYRLLKNKVQAWTQLREEIAAQPTNIHLLMMAKALLNAEDTVLNLCVAVEMAKYFGQPSSLYLANKNMHELRILSQEHVPLVETMKTKIDETLSQQPRLRM